MLIELANHSPVALGLDDQPKITTIHIPEYDDGSTHPDARYDGRHPLDDGTGPVGKLRKPGPRLGGYTHEPGLSVKDFKGHIAEAISQPGPRRGITSLPDHEVLLSLLHPDGMFPFHFTDTPRWVQVTPHALTPEGRANDIEQFLSDYFSIPTAREYFRTEDPEELLVRKELGYWTRTPPGDIPPGLSLPNARALYTDDGRVISNVNDGGGQVGAIGQATAASGTTLTTASTYTLNQWAGYRVYVVTGAGTMVWGNVVSNTAAAGASVLTVDRWYAPATPGGSAGSTPASFTGSNATFIIADGGFVSTWFVGLATGANAPAHGDHTLATNGNAEITTAGGGLVRKIAPYAQTSGVASRSLTLTPVFTANASDTLPVTTTTIGVFCSMVVGTLGTMKFEPALNASATLSAINDQLTVTETVTGS